MCLSSDIVIISHVDLFLNALLDLLRVESQRNAINLEFVHLLSLFLDLPSLQFGEAIVLGIQIELPLGLRFPWTQSQFI